MRVHRLETSEKPMKWPGKKNGDERLANGEMNIANDLPDVGADETITMDLR